MENEVNTSAANESLGASGCDSWEDVRLPEGVEIRRIDDKIGRGIFATKAFAKGEVVLKDYPMVSCQHAWNKVYGYKACEFCMRALETAEENIRRLADNKTIELSFPECCETKKNMHVTCPECLAEFCSEKCRQLALSSYHSILCHRSRAPIESHPIFVLDDYWRNFHYPPETANIFLVVRLLALIQLDKSGNLAKRLSEFCQLTASDELQTMHKVLGEEYVNRVGIMRDMVKNILTDESIQQWLEPEAFIRLLVLVSRNAQGVASSAFSNYVFNVEKLPDEINKSALKQIDKLYEQAHDAAGDFWDNEGTALYSLQSLINHSCVPNTVVKFPFNNHVVIIEATENINPEDEITIMYFDLEDAAHSRHSRNKYLKEHYLFVCKCPKCILQADDPDCTSEEDMEDNEDDDSTNEGENDMSD